MVFKVRVRYWFAELAKKADQSELRPSDFVGQDLPGRKKLWGEVRKLLSMNKRSNEDRAIDLSFHDLMTLSSAFFQYLEKNNVPYLNEISHLSNDYFADFLAQIDKEIAAVIHAKMNFKDNDVPGFIVAELLELSEMLMIADDTARLKSVKGFIEKRCSDFDIKNGSLPDILAIPDEECTTKAFFAFTDEMFLKAEIKANDAARKNFATLILKHLVSSEKVDSLDAMIGVVSTILTDSDIRTVPEDRKNIANWLMETKSPIMRLAENLIRTYQLKNTNLEKGVQLPICLMLKALYRIPASFMAEEIAVNEPDGIDTVVSKKDLPRKIETLHRGLSDNVTYQDYTKFEQIFPVTVNAVAESFKQLERIWLLVVGLAPQPTPGWVLKSNEMVRDMIRRYGDKEILIPLRTTDHLAKWGLDGSMGMTSGR